jgi:hypothetical protein
VSITRLSGGYIRTGSIPTSALGGGVVSSSAQVISALPSNLISSSAQVTSLLPNGTVSASSQVNYTQLSSIPSGIVSSSTQIPAILPTGTVSSSTQIPALLPNGTVSASSQVVYTSLSSIPAGIVSGTTQVTNLLPTGTVSSSAQLPSGIVSSSTQIPAILPNGTVSQSSQVVYTSLSSIPSGIVSGSTQIPALLPTGIVSSSTQIPALLPTGTVSASSQVSYTGLSNTPSGIVSSSTQIPTLLPNGTVSASSQVVYTSLSSIPSGIVSSSTQIPALLPNGTVSASSQVQLASITGTTFAATDYTFPNNLIVGGRLTAQEFYTELVSSSVIYESGSTKFGDTADDRHSFTGSLFVVGPVSASIFTGSGANLSNIPNSALVNSSVTVNGQSVSLGGSTTITANTTNTLTLGNGLTGTSFNGGGAVTTTVDTGSTHFTGGVTTAINARGVFSASAQVSYTGLSSVPSGIVSSSTQIPAILPNGTVSASSQVAHNSTTGYVANEHINHTSVSITAGNGISGGGDISTTRTITLDTGSTHFTGGVTTAINARAVFSSSAQVTYTSLSSIPSGIVSSSTQIPALLPNGTVSASSQVSFTSISNRPSGLVSASSQVVYTSLSSIPSGIVSSSTQIPALLPNGTVSASSQVAHGSTTGYVANEHINHTSVSITAGSGMSGGGDISATRTLTLDTSSAHFTGGVTTRINALGVVSSSGQIAHGSTSGYVANEHINHTSVTLTAGSGLTGGGDISTSRTFTVGAGLGITVNADDVAVDTGSAHFTGGVTTRVNALGVYSSSAQLVVSAYTNATDNRVITSTGAGGVNGEANLTFDGSTLTVTGALNATTKSFYIDHKKLIGKKLVYGVLEGPEHAVYVRGKLTDNNQIELPSEWEWLVDMDSITVQLTPIGGGQKLYVENILSDKVIIGNDNLFNKQINCYYLVHATRKDVPQLQTVV